MDKMWFSNFHPDFFDFKRGTEIKLNDVDFDLFCYSFLY